MRRHVSLALLVLLAGVTPTVAALPSTEVLAPPVQAAPLAVVEQMRFAMPDRAQLATEDIERTAQGLPYRFAVPEDVAYTPANSGTWQVLADGRALWRLRVTVPGAQTLNLGFVRYDVPATARLAIYPAAGGTGQVYDNDDVRLHGQLWTPVLRADDIVVELVVAADERGLVELELGTVGKGYRGFGTDPEAKSGACNIDVVCPEGDDWRNEIKSVAAYGFGGSRICTGSLLNNTALDERPLFLTAHHCNLTDLRAPTLVVYWNYDSPVCDQHGGGDITQTQSGSTVLADFLTTDFTLVELDDIPTAEFDVRYAGWDRRSVDPSSSVGIHHPQGDEKSISKDHDPATTTNYLGDVATGNGTHLRVGAWEEGTTEDGSSGSPLFNQDHQVVGQLHGGYASCTNTDAADWYGRLSVSWDGGGTAETRLSDWLDPLGNGAETLDVLGVGLAVMPEAEAVFNGGVGGPFTPTEVVYTVINSSDRTLEIRLETSAPWLTADVMVTTLAPGAGTDLTLAVDDGATAAFPPGARTAVARVLLAAAGTVEAEVTARLTILRGRPDITSFAPNPNHGLVEMHYTMGASGQVHGRVFDLRGRRVADLGSWDASVGANVLDWTGRDENGERLAGGVYVFELEGSGGTSRRQFVLVR